MDITAYKLQLITDILKLQDISVIKQITAFLEHQKTEKNDVPDEKSTQIISKLLQQSEQDFLNEKLTSHSAFEKEAKLWS